jgi:acyl-CoA synthetase (AMP-forming)/AMP-acid ligase II
VLDRVVPEAARRFGDHPALLAADGTPTSYRELDRASDEAAVGLARRGVGLGSVVALTLPSTPEYVVAYVALAKLGAVAAGVNPRLTDAERAVALDVIGPDHVLEGGVERLRVRDEAPPALAADPERPVAIVLTSGTTGRPRGAEFRVRQIAAVTAADVGDTWGGGGPMIASTQFAHIGFMTKLAWYLRLGTTQLLVDRWRAGDVLDLVERHRVSSLGGVAPQIALMLRDPDFDRRDLSCVETIVVGAAPSPPALVREARERFGAAYSIRYSSTESGGVGTGTAFDAPDEEALHTVGRPRPPVELAIRDGEVCLRSPTVMAGYWRDPEATAEVLRDGWLHTGDLGSIDDAGCLRLVGRAQEMFIRGGYNVYPLELEAVLSQHPAVAEVAVAPRPDEVMGEIGVAVVVPRDAAAPPSLDDLRAFAADRLAAHKLPEALRLVPALPLTAMQKLDRRALAAHESRSGSRSSGSGR